MKVCSCDKALELVQTFKEKSEKRNRNQSFFSTFGNAECPVPREMDTEQNRHVVCAAIFAYFLQGMNRIFDRIFIRVFAGLRSSSSYSSAGSNLRLVLGRPSNENAA